ncbi:MAG: Fe-S cluster assembly protein SufD [Deltaproteobacteria bacterium]|nr:Fe-S cluster assembly protein SufD [Deltaproteobacteria bacterium]
MPEAAETALAALRAAGRARFEADGLPSTKAEAWRYFPTRALRGRDLLTPAAGGALAVTRDDVLAHVISGVSGVAVFVDGAFIDGLSFLGGLPDGVRVGGLGATLAEGEAVLADVLGRVADVARDGLVAANAAAFTDGLRLDVAKGIVVEAPVLALFLRSDAAVVCQPRSVVTLGRGAAVTLVTRHVAVGAAAGEGGGELVDNAVLEVLLGEGAALRHVVADEGGAGFSVLHTHVKLSRDARYRGFLLSLGEGDGRASFALELAGEGTECELDGLVVARGGARRDVFTDVDHQVPHTRSAQGFAALADDKATATYQGRVSIREGARRADARQQSRNLILSEGAQVHTKPELRIDNDDVAAAHGTTVGQLDEGALFYLASRGFSPEEARRVLTAAFAGEALESLGDEPWALALRRIATGRLPGGRLEDAADGTEESAS